MRLSLLVLLLSSARAFALPLELGVELVVEGPTHRPRHIPVTLAPGDCPQPQHCWKALVHDEDVSLSVTLGPGERALPFAVEVLAERPQAIRQIVLRLFTGADDFTLLGRDYRPAHPSRAILDRFDPKWVTLTSHHAPFGALLADDDLDSLAITREHGHVIVDIELMSVLARPFGHLPRCGQKWRDVHGRVIVADRFLHAGDHLVASGELLVGDAQPVALSPWPDGRDAAFVITDHADQTGAETLHALLGGSASADLDHATKGLFGHHVPITKALFLHGTAHHETGSLELDEAEVQKLAERLRQNGSELAPHSATPMTDSREVVDDALDKFAAHGATVWIDHQPQTNCEGFSQAGWRTGTGISDLLDKHHFTDVWDLTEWSGAGLDERDPRHLDKRAPTIWPLGRLEPEGPDSLWMFRSTWAFIPQREFYLRYGDKSLDQLEHDRGLHIAHTYLETLHPRGTFFGRRNLEVRDPSGQAALDPRFDGVLASLQMRSTRGTLWLTPLGPLATRLRALRDVRLRIDEAGALTVSRPAGLPGVTVHFSQVPKLDDAQSTRPDDGAVRVWLAPCEGSDPCTTQIAHDLLR